MSNTASTQEISKEEFKRLQDENNVLRIENNVMREILRLYVDEAIERRKEAKNDRNLKSIAFIPK